MKRLARRGALGCGGALALVVLLVAGYLGYAYIHEHFDPSGRVYILQDGKREYLVQPTALVTPPPQSPVAVAGSTSRPVAAASPQPISSPQVAPAVSPAATEQATEADNGGSAPVPLPPLQLQIPAIGVDVPVSLVTSDNVPHIKIAGWLFHTAFPATAGNTVLVGHLDGPGAIFGQLRVLKPGDLVRVRTQDTIITYQIDRLTVVSETAVDVIAPTSDSVITLITCAGDWDPVAKSYHQRLVARGHLASIQSLH